MFSPIDLATRVSLFRPYCASNKPTAVIQQFNTENNNARKALCTVATLLNLVRRFEDKYWIRQEVGGHQITEGDWNLLNGFLNKQLDNLTNVLCTNNVQ